MAATCHSRACGLHSLLRLAALALLARNAPGMLGFLGATRSSVPPRVARAAIEPGKVNVGAEVTPDKTTSVPLPLVESGIATKNAIMDCVAEGCSVEAIMALDEKLASDEARILETKMEVTSKQKTENVENGAEMLAWLDNFLARTGALRAQLKASKEIKDRDFLKQLVKAASVAFGGGRPSDYPAVGVSPYSA